MSQTENLNYRQSFSKFSRFLFAGGLNTLVGFFVFSVAIYLTDENVGFSLAVNIVIGVFFNYLNYGYSVFKSLGMKQFGKFTLAYLMLYVINYLALNLMIEIDFNVYFAQFINLFYLAPLSYLIFNRWVFVVRPSSKLPLN